MLQDHPASIQFEQTQLSFSGEFDHIECGKSAVRRLSHGGSSSKNGDFPVIRNDNDYSGYILKVKPLTTESAKRISALSSIVQRSFEIRRYEDAGHILNHFTAAFVDFWNKRHTQYSSTERFIRRVSRVFNISVDQARVTQRYLNLPDCATAPTRNLDQYRFASCLYIDANETVRDPLDRYYGRTIQKQSTLQAWDNYLAEYAYLTPEALDPSDIRFVLRNYPMSIERAAMMLQVRTSELADYANQMNFPISYRASALPVRDLLGNQKHERLTSIVLKAAQTLYTHQAIPLRIIAERIGIDVNMLFEMGERDVGDWILPQLSTIHHVIEVTTLLHVEAGGVLRQNVNG